MDFLNIFIDIVITLYIIFIMLNRSSNYRRKKSKWNLILDVIEIGAYITILLIHFNSYLK